MSFKTLVDGKYVGYRVLKNRVYYTTYNDKRLSRQWYPGALISDTENGFLVYSREAAALVMQPNGANHFLVQMAFKFNTILHQSSDVATISLAYVIAYREL